jgi:hypothetical protein
VTLWLLVPLPWKAARTTCSASLRKLIFPAELPVRLGEKVILKGTLWPARTVRGKTIPLTEYPSPLQSADVTVMVESPAVRVAVWC